MSLHGNEPVTHSVSLTTAPCHGPHRCQTSWVNIHHASIQPCPWRLAHPHPLERGPGIRGNAFDRAGQLGTLLKATVLSTASHGPWLGDSIVDLVSCCTECANLSQSSQSSLHSIESRISLMAYFDIHIMKYSQKNAPMFNGTPLHT